MRRVTCVMPTTATRRWCIPWAIEYFLRQSYINSELLIVGDGDEPVDDLVPAHPRVQYVHAAQTPTLGDKYNLCINLTTADWIALWADDDWHADWRLTYTMDQLARRPHHEIAGTRTMLFYDMGARQSWLYQYPPNERDLIGGSLVFRRAYWERHHFESRARGSDTIFTQAMGADEWNERAIVLDNADFYVAMDHGENTSPRDGYPGTRWTRWDGELESIMGDDAERYETFDGV